MDAVFVFCYMGWSFLLSVMVFLHPLEGVHISTAYEFASQQNTREWVGFVIVFDEGRGYVLLCVTIQHVCAFGVQQAIFRYLRASRMNGER